MCIFLCRLCFNFNYFSVKKKRTCIISDESESETKNADNEENTVKTESPFSCNLRLFLDLAIINAWIIIQRDQNCNKLE